MQLIADVRSYFSCARLLALSLSLLSLGPPRLITSRSQCRCCSSCSDAANSTVSSRSLPSSSQAQERCVCERERAAPTTAVRRAVITPDGVQPSSLHFTSPNEACTCRRASNSGGVLITIADSPVSRTGAGKQPASAVSGHESVSDSGDAATLEAKEKGVVTKNAKAERQAGFHVRQRFMQSDVVGARVWLSADTSAGKG